MTREEFYKLIDILNSDVLGSFMHGGEADELIAMFEEVVEHSNILKQEESVSKELEEAANNALNNVLNTHEIVNVRSCLEMFRFGANWKKEQLIKEAINGIARPDDGEVWCDLRPFNLKDGDKLKLIIIKED